MKRIYMCGHTGSINRGCEAIIRSTAEILKKCGINDIYAFTFNLKDDINVALNEEVNLIPYPKKSILLKGLGYVENCIFKHKIYGNYPLYKLLFKENPSNIVTMNVGGDTYCYGKPNISYALNNIAKTRGFPNIFWGCSVDGRVIDDIEKQKDINKYSYIIARETLTEAYLKQIVDDKTKVYLACDPAFNLTVKKTELPENFIKDNTVGINLSPMVFNDYKNFNDDVYKNVYTLIDYILEETDMNVCLIPHVYNIEKNLQDYFVLSNIYEKYRGTLRIGIVNKELSCTELKYIISKCRFFIGARTHATIAAYSTGIPTIALSYSIKSLGIAKDLFGTYEGYAVKWQDIKQTDMLKSIFVNTLVYNEEKIKSRYSKIMPSYKQSILDVSKDILLQLGMCD